MKNPFILFALCELLTLASVLPCIGAPQLQLSAAKKEYVASEPILLRVVIQNDAMPFAFQTKGLEWSNRTGFSFEAASNEGTFEDLAIPGAGIRMVGCFQFGTIDNFADRYWVPQQLGPSEKSSRVEMLVAKPGTHRIRAILKDKAARYVSNEITVTVKPRLGNDSITRLGDANTIEKFAEKLLDAHYLCSLGNASDAQPFLDLAQTVLRDHRDSAFHPYTLYVLAKGQLYYKTSPPLSPERAELALAAGQQFLSAHGDSWLVPDLAVTVCAALAEKGRLDEAVVVGRQALTSDPNSLLLRHLNFSERLRQIEAKLNAPPVITILGANPVTIECGGAYADAGATATDDKDGDITTRIIIENNVDTPKVGTYQVIYRVTDAAGNAATATRTVKVVYKFDGFLAPVGGADATGGNYANPVRTFKLGSTVPVKFKISCGGAAVKDGAHTLQVIKYNNETTAAEPIDATPTDAATTGNQFKLTGDEWHFNLDTKATGMTTGTWQLKATLGDGSTHLVWIALK